MKTDWTKATDDELKAAIASHMGLEFVLCGEKTTHNSWSRWDDHWRYKGLGDHSVKIQVLPDWPNDLNACHEMEKHLGNKVHKEELRPGVFKTWTDNGRYLMNLTKVIAEELGGWKDHCIEAIGLCHLATARQRCIAFIITVS